MDLFFRILGSIALTTSCAAMQLSLSSFHFKINTKFENTLHTVDIRDIHTKRAVGVIVLSAKTTDTGCVVSFLERHYKLTSNEVDYSLQGLATQPIQLLRKLDNIVVSYDKPYLFEDIEIECIK